MVKTHPLLPVATIPFLADSLLTVGRQARRWWRYYAGRQDQMRAQLQQLAELPELSPDVFEVVTKSLK